MPGVRPHAHARVVDLVIERGWCTGVKFLADDGSMGVARAKAVLLATGGAGHVYRDTTNPPVATGDGVAMAYRGGARVADLEFVQFHPTALMLPGEPRFLLSEALRGEGARLLNAQGEPFMTRYEAAGDLASRDRVSRGIVRETERTGAVYLSMEHLDPAFVHSRFPLISEACRRVGPGSRARSHPGRAGGALRHGGRADRHRRAHVDSGALRGGRSGVHRRARRQPAGEQFAARGTRLRRPRRVCDARRFAGRVVGRAARRSSSSTRHVTAGSEPSDECGGAVTIAEVQDLMWRQVGLFRDREGLSGALARAGSAVARDGCTDRRRRAARPGGVARGEHRDGRTADRARGAAPRGEPRRPFPLRFPAARRYTLETPRLGNARREARRSD